MVKRKTCAQALWKEFTPRVEHCEHILLGVQSKMGNFALVSSQNVPTKLLREIKKLINDELRERRMTREG